MLYEIRQGLMNVRSLDDVIVIQHEREVLSLPTTEVVGEHGQHRLKFCGLWGSEQSERGIAKVWIKRLQGSYEIGEESGGLVILGFEREPGDGHVCGGQPLGKERRFPKTGGGRDERERACYSLLKPLDEVGARHELGAGTRMVELGREQGSERITMLVCRCMWCQDER